MQKHVLLYVFFSLKRRRQECTMVTTYKEWWKKNVYQFLQRITWSCRKFARRYEGRRYIIYSYLFQQCIFSLVHGVMSFFGVFYVRIACGPTSDCAPYILTFVVFSRIYFNILFHIITACIILSFKYVLI